VGLFVLVGGVMYVGAERSAARQAEVGSRYVADFTRARLEQVMQSGASRELIERAASTILASLAGSSPYTVRLYPAAGAASEATDQPGTRLAWVFATGREAHGREGHRYVTYFPVVAKPACVACHTKVGCGGLLSVLEVSHDLEADLAPQRLGLLLLLLLVLPLPLLVALAASRRFTARLSRAVGVVHEGARKVARGEELGPSDLTPDLAYEELEVLFDEVRVLADALQETRDLRFQVSALDAMTLSAEPVADWRNEVAHVAAALRRTMPLRALVTAFARLDGAVDVAVFWSGAPSDAERQALVGIVAAKWAGTGRAPAAGAYEHVVVPAPSSDAPALPDLGDCIATFHGTRIPRVGGVTQVGLVLASGFVVRPLVLRSVLGTLQGTVGALHAIDGYLRQIEYHATRDALTQLPNRRMFNELLACEVERARRHGYSFAVLMLDLDGFKQVNDRWGHAFGDRFLAAVAQALVAVARTEDVLARYGGDEFVLIASGADVERIRQVGQRLLERLAAFSMPAPDGTPLGAAASLGAAVFPQNGADAQEIFRRADAEMYRAKSAGKGCLRIAGVS